MPSILHSVAMPIQRPNSNRSGQGEISYRGFAPPEPAPRRIVQIAVTYDPSDDIREDRLYALCNDGSAWVMIWDGREDGDHSRWGRLADIPQD